MDGPEAVTIGQAAAALHVSKPRVHQMLNDRVLTGPKLPEGRAPKNAPRVWRRDLEREISARSANGKLEQSDKPSSSPPPPRGGGDGADARGGGDEVYRLKVALDSARDALRSEREQSRRLTALLVDAVGALEHEQQQGDRADRITDGFSDALTALLGPRDARDV